ncbi:unnamed protein product, partial [Symbiodinium microadriaticum]
DVIAEKKKLKQACDAELKQAGLLREQLKELELQALQCETKRDAALGKLGNFVDLSVPTSQSEVDNEVISTWPSASPEEHLSHDCGRRLLSHEDLLWRIGGYDPDRGCKVAGSRGYFLEDTGVLLSQALVSYGLAFLRARGYRAVQPPYFMRKDLMAGVAQLDDFDQQLYKVTKGEQGDATEEGDKYLIATSEQPLCAFHAKEVLNAEALPLRYAGVSTCFRIELGKAGRENRGIFRVHQFEKVEQFCITAGDPELSGEMHSEMLRCAEEFYQSLEIPYRVVKVVSGELNDAATMKYDLEGWFAGQGQYRELVSCSNCTDFQSRALDIRYRPAGSQDKQRLRHVHMLNSTLTASGRCLCCMLEAFQTPDGVRIPSVLVPFTGGIDFLPFVRTPRQVGTVPKTGVEEAPVTEGEPKPKSLSRIQELEEKLLHSPYVTGFEASKADLHAINSILDEVSECSTVDGAHAFVHQPGARPLDLRDFALWTTAANAHCSWSDYGASKIAAMAARCDVSLGSFLSIEFQAKFLHGGKSLQLAEKSLYPVMFSMADEGSDIEESQGQRKAEVIPDAVDHFLGRLLDSIKSSNIPDINRLYETDFNQLTEKYYNKTKWPSAYAVADALGHGEALFLILYKELYYRHIYARLNPVLFEDRIGSWKNYTQLLDLMIENLSDGEDLGIALPAQWLWDILDEFVYHYQTYSTYCHKAAKLQKEADVKQLVDNPAVFETTKVLSYLHQLVRYSLIEEWLANPDGGNGQGAAFTDESTRLIGYFALMQLLRMHSLLGDYRLAMETIENIDFRAEVPLFYRIPACHVTVFYYMGFAYMMMRRYVDASRTFQDILVFLSKISTVNSLSYQYDQMLKKQDQMYVLLLICNALCPQPLDESLEKPIREKHADKQMRLQQGNEACFEDLFSYACPKFVAASMPDLENLENFTANEAHQRQLTLFLQEVRQQQALPTIGSYMKLYTSLQTSKLAQLCEMDGEGLRDQLMCVMHKTRQLVHQRVGTPLDGELNPCGEVEFYLDGDMVHINAQKPQRPHADVFLEHIRKFQDILKRADKIEKPSN